MVRRVRWTSANSKLKDLVLIICTFQHKHFRFGNGEDEENEFTRLYTSGPAGFRLNSFAPEIDITNIGYRKGESSHKLDLEAPSQLPVALVSNSN